MTRIRIEPTNRRIRARQGDREVADTTRARLLFVEGRHPEYVFDSRDIDIDLNVIATEVDEAGTFERIGDGGRRYVDGPAAGLVALDFETVDEWFEEDEQVLHRPRDPYRRVDVLESNRQVEVSIDGVVVAKTTTPRLVDETGLPPRWYIPPSDVDWSVLIPSNTTSACQYKGVASWWVFAVDPNRPLVDVAWSYEDPIPEAPKLAGFVSFLAEHDHVDVTVDGAAVAIPAFEPSWVSPSLHIDDAALSPRLSS